MSSENILPRPEAFGPAFAAAAAIAANTETNSESEILDAMKIIDQDMLNLGDLNPLIHPVDLSRSESVRAISIITKEKIIKYDGLLPRFMESSVVFDPGTEKSGLRFIARFEVPNLEEEQMVLLEELVKQTYGITVRTRTDSKGNDVPEEIYPPIQKGEEYKAKTGGWYMGPNMSPTGSLHTGLFVFRDLGTIKRENFFKNLEASSKYIVEIREAGLQQTDLVTFITQTAAVLQNGELLDKGELFYETYYDLIRLGLKKVDSQSLYGMDNAINMIHRELLTPLASPEISRAVKQDPQSVLMVGVPGTGKTLVVEQLLQDDTGVFILPIDPYELQTELRLPKEKQTLLPRISEVSKISGKRVVLHVDDIENLAQGFLDTHSTILNLMAGVKESGFHVIASTNYPEKIDPALLQPQRFGVLIHCPLQDEKARFEILKIHSDQYSAHMQIPLFQSDEEREEILRAIARKTDSFTPRYLGQIATIAKSLLIERVAQSNNKRVGLQESNLEGFTMTKNDWERAYEEVRSTYDAKAVKLRSDLLLEFVKKHQRSHLGFPIPVQDNKPNSDLYSEEFQSAAEGELPFTAPK